MGFDGIVTKAIVSELNNVLIGAKVNSIYEPNKNEILIGVYNRGKQYALNLCIDSTNYRVHLTTRSKPNPLVAPNFCMLLRKHLIGSKIKEIKSYDLERIVKITFEGYNELNDFVEKKLYTEIMGKYSNIALVNENNIIIDSLRHVESSYRSLLPAREYEYPTLHKYSIIECDSFDNFYKIIQNKLKQEDILSSIDKIMSDLFIGISRPFIQYICDKLDIDMNEISPQNFKKLYEYIKQLLNLANQSISLMPVNIFNNDYTIEINHTDDFLPINFFIDDFYYLKEEQDEFKKDKNNILKIILSVLKKLTKRIENIDFKLKECKNIDKYKLYGELITANLYRYKDQKLAELSIENYYDNNSIITIPLDNSITVSANATKYFKKYNKLRNTYSIVSKQKKDTQKELYYLQSIVYVLENVTTVEEIDEIYSELSENILFKGLNKKKIKLISKKKENALTPIDYEIDGYKVLVGKNNKQNDYLTFKLANKNDIWFHAKDIHGSHVILKSNGKEVNIETLIKCAGLAAYHSKGKNSTKVLVDYTYIKNVKKTSGAEPGMVIYVQQKTINVKPRSIS